MRRTDISLNWTRAQGGRRFFGPGGAGEPVNLPDDFILNAHRSPDAVGGASTGFFPSGSATYTKQLGGDFAPTVILHVDGAYMLSEVSLNGDLINRHAYGYTPFDTDLSDKLRRGGDNALSIFVNSVQPSSRWYSGGGIYRRVSLLTAGDTYIHPNDIFYHTERIENGAAIVRAEVTVTNRGADLGSCRLRAVFDGIDRGGREITITHGTTTISFKFEISDARLWSDEHPELYTARMDLIGPDGNILDADERAFGLRVIEIDAKKGMRVNGTPVKLRGGCVHHDNALIGARAMPRAEERKVQALKDAGFNAIRCAHNPPSEDFLNACDRIGMYVLDETFDAWVQPKNELDYHVWFEDNWQEDTRAMVLRDRNHPSVYAWSIGNEISEMNGQSDGVRWCKLQAEYVRALDPTRPVSSSVNHFVFPKNQNRQLMMHTMDMREELTHPKVSNGMAGDFDYWDEGSKDTLNLLDICGYNYLWPRYAMDREKHPDRVIHGTETHAFHMYDYWKAVLDNPNAIGDFTWTATDNLGEGGAGRVIWQIDEGFQGLIGSWPWLSCYQGDLDLDLNRRPQSYYRKIVWGLDKGIHLFTTHPERTGQPYYGMGWHWAEVFPTWTFEDKYIGQNVALEAYADADEVEFILNGSSVGSVPVEKYKAFCTIPYQPGKVEAVAWRDGKEIARTSLETAGKPTAIRLTADRQHIRADGMDLCYITASVVDDQGRVYPAEQSQLAASISGAGEILGIGSANPCTEEDYGTGTRLTCQGKALIAVRAGQEAGTAHLRVTAEGLEASEIDIYMDKVKGE